MPFLDSPGARLHYEVWEPLPGSTAKGCVTLLNGFTRTLADFQLLGRHLTERGFRVLALDNRGAGKTECGANFTVEDMAADVAALWDSLSWETSDLVGISQGGMIALVVALEQPERVRRLVLVSTAASRQFVAAREWERDPARIEQGLLEHFSPLFVENQKLLLKAMVKEMARAFQDPERAARAAMQRAAMKGFDVTKRLPEIRAKTLLLHGDFDRVIPPIAAETMARAIPKARLHMHPTAGHLLLAEEPRYLYDEIGTFLEK